MTVWAQFSQRATWPPSVRPNCSLSATSTSSSHSRSDRRHRLPEQSRDLWSAVHGGGRSHPDDRRRSQTAWRQDRHHRRAPQLGLGDDASSARAHDRAVRRHLARWHALGIVPPAVLSAGAGPLAPVPAIIPGQPPRCSPGWTSRVLRRPHRARQTAIICCLPRAAAQDRMGGLCQETRSPGRRPCSPIYRATPTASPSPIAG